MKKNIFLVTSIGICFVYGFLLGHYKVFPYSYLASIKHSFDTYFEPSGEAKIEFTEDIEVLNTFLHRLLLKKIQLSNFESRGGGITTAGDLFFLVSNKGYVTVYNLKNYEKSNLELPEVPMNLNDMIRSGHMYKNDFRIPWFRVNGVFAEKTENSDYILYVSHNAYISSSDCITHNLSRVRLTSGTEGLYQADEWRTIFTAEPCINPDPVKWVSAVPYSGHISGGKIISFDDYRVLITIGDYNLHGIDGVDEYAMDYNKPYGKTLLVNKETGEWEVYSAGSRNPSGLYMDQDQVIWMVENGPQGGDEMNIIEKGDNLGWPRESYGLWYDNRLDLPGGHKKGTHQHYKAPLFSWVPSVAPSAILKIEKNSFDYWKGDLIVATMRDQSLHRLRIGKDLSVKYNERIFIGHRIRDLTALPNGDLALITDDSYLIFIADGGAIFARDKTIDEINTILNKYDNFAKNTNLGASLTHISRAKEIFKSNCGNCHNLDYENYIGPHLNNLFERQVGGLEDFRYSKILQNDQRYWDKDLLRLYLKNPENAGFEGTSMNKINITDSEVDSIIQYLSQY